jgi:hypothetical protein
MPFTRAAVVNAIYSCERTAGQRRAGMDWRVLARPKNQPLQ